VRRRRRRRRKGQDVELRFASFFFPSLSLTFVPLSLLLDHQICIGVTGFEPNLSSAKKSFKFYRGRPPRAGVPALPLSNLEAQLKRLRPPSLSYEGQGQILLWRSLHQGESKAPSILKTAMLTNLGRADLAFPQPTTNLSLSPLSLNYSNERTCVTPLSRSQETSTSRLLSNDRRQLSFAFTGETPTSGRGEGGRSRSFLPKCAVRCKYFRLPGIWCLVFSGSRTPRRRGSVARARSAVIVRARAHPFSSSSSVLSVLGPHRWSRHLHCSRDVRCYR